LILRLFLLLLFAALFFAGCSSSVYYEFPVDLKNSELKAGFLKKYSPYLNGKKIFVDPGHGGGDRRSVGINKLTTEADANLRVALALRNFLLEAGAVVFMSRDKDATVDLKERSYMANKSGADVFISIHHNAPGGDKDYWTNYTSTYYHAKETDYEYEPNERDLARFVQRDMAYAMRNSGGLGSFDGTYSDYWIYPGNGFSVLRLTEIPSILVECGFFTNAHEEARISDEKFNKIQAWGIFRGIARYFAAGIPEVKPVNEKSFYAAGDVKLKYSLIDSAGIDQSKIRVLFDSLDVVGVQFNNRNNELTVDLPSVKEGEYELKIIAANKYGNHNFPYKKKIKIIN